MQGLVGNMKGFINPSNTVLQVLFKNVSYETLQKIVRLENQRIYIQRKFLKKFLKTKVMQNIGG
jgi:hypothetical protein